MNLARALQFLCGLLLLLLPFGCSSTTWTLEELSDAPKLAGPSFLLLADTQYSVPVTDYDLSYEIEGQQLDVPPEVSTLKAKTFYRHSAATRVLPAALEAVIERAIAQGMSFGVLAGDMVEFACKDEAKEIFNVLRRQPRLPFLIALGNHDVLFHGSYDGDALRAMGQAPWDEYSYAMWGSVCEPHGGRLTKPDVIRLVLDYYRDVLGLPLPDIKVGDEPLQGSVSSKSKQANAAGLSLSYSVLLSEPGPSAHRHSHLWQRFSVASKSAVPATLTLLDTTDYADRRALCDFAGMVLQLGMSGALSAGQIAWLEKQGAVSGPHFVVSHYLPFRDVDAESDCSLTAGAHCSWANRVVPSLFRDSVFVYAHVHRDFERQQLKHTEQQLSLDLVRLPSLIDNKSYVTFDDGAFASVQLEPPGNFEAEKLFAHTKETCAQRHRELVEFERNLDCFSGSCRPLAGVQTLRSEERRKICQQPESFSTANAGLWRRIKDNECRGWPAHQRWRCILRGLGRVHVEDAKLTPERYKQFALQQLASVHTVRTD